MKGRLRDWDETKMLILRDPKAAQGYLLACMKEGVPLKSALRDVLRAQGYSKLSKSTKIARPNILRAVRAGTNPTFDTMERLLKGVGLEFSVRPIKKAA